MRKIIFELCAESIEACLAAHAGGAGRIELCAALNQGGLTPSHALIHQAIAQSGLPIHVLLRPRAGDFCYTPHEFALMREDLIHAKTLGASGFVLGILLPDSSVDVERTRSLVALAAPLEVTFHRAFDYTPSLDAALESVIAAGCQRVLTSGGEPDVRTGAPRIAELVARANGRIEVAVGGGLRIHDAAALAAITGATHFHGSVRTKPNKDAPPRPWVLEELDATSSTSRFVVDAADVRALIDALHQAVAK